MIYETRRFFKAFLKYFGKCFSQQTGVKFHTMRKEPYAGGEFYRKQKGLVSVAIYIPLKVRAAYKKAANRLKTSAQKLMAAVLIKNRPR
jgi:hypothetical protein